MNQNLHVNKTNFHMKGFAIGLALKQKRSKSEHRNNLFSVFGTAQYV